MKDFSSKALKNREEKKQSKRRDIREKKQQGCCVSPSKCPAHLAPILCMTVFYHLSFLHLPLPPVRLGGTELEKALYVMLPLASTFQITMTNSWSVLQSYQ
jgi:hypothetical protein